MPLTGTPLVDLRNVFTHLIFEGHDTLPVIEIALESAGHTDPRIALFGASLSATGPLTTITCRHATGTDIEHDSAHLADFEIAGLTPTSTLRTGIFFQGHLVSGSFYIGDQTPEKIADDGPHDPYLCLSGCESSPHRTDLPFKPPAMQIVPVPVRVSVSFPQPDRRAKRLTELATFNEDLLTQAGR